MKNHSLYLIILIVLLGAGCKRGDDRAFYSIDATTKSLLNWQAGSYWIMQDSTTGQIDSFYVVSYKLETFKGSYADNEMLNIEISVSVPL